MNYSDEISNIIIVAEEITSKYFDKYYDLVMDYNKEYNARDRFSEIRSKQFEQVIDELAIRNAVFNIAEYSFDDFDDIIEFLTHD